MITAIHKTCRKSFVLVFGSLVTISCGTETSTPEKTEQSQILESQTTEAMANFSPQKNLEFLFGGQVYTKAQIASLLRSTGFPEKAIGTMICIAKYESSFNTSAINRNKNGTTDYGLFQINSYYWGKTCGVTGNQLLNPTTNARCALKVYRQHGYEAWYGYRYHRQECNSTPAPR